MGLVAETLVDSAICVYKDRLVLPGCIPRA